MFSGSNIAVSCLLAAAVQFQVAVHAQVSTPIKWACIGNSITEGAGATVSYPVRLGNKLGAAFSVQNDGVSGTTLLKKGDKPYWTQGKLGDVFAFKPDIVTIKLGTNDTKPQNWQFQADFVKDVTALVDTLSGISSHPRIFLCLPVPVFPNTVDGINDAALQMIIPRIKQVATAKGLAVIDVNTPLKSSGSLFPDGVHPNDAGADSIASIIYRTFAAQAKRVSCIGNSITQYVGVVPGALPADAYPAKLNMLLGRDYLVQNAGVSGCYMLKPNGGIPTLMSYWNKGKLADVFAFKPGIVTISLGTNDSRPKAWNTARFTADYASMIDTLYSRITPKPQVWLVRPMPAWQVNGQWQFSTPDGTTDNGINGNTIRDSVIPAIADVAARKALPTADLYTRFQTLKSYVADGVHPNAAGEDTIAHVVFRALKEPATSIGGEPAPRSSRSRPDRAPRPGFRKRIPGAGFLLPGPGSRFGWLFLSDGRAVPAFRRD